VQVTVSEEPMQRAAELYREQLDALVESGLAARLTGTHVAGPHDEAGLAIRVPVGDSSADVLITAADVTSDSEDAWDTALPWEGPDEVVGWCVSLYSADGAPRGVDRWALVYGQLALVKAVRQLSRHPY
jgi:hypothetical protein